MFTGKRDIKARASQLQALNAVCCSVSSPSLQPATCRAFPSFLISGCLTVLVGSLNFAKTFLNPLKSLHQSCFIWTLGKNSISYGTIAVQFSSVTQSCLTLCDPMDCSTPGLPVHHQLPELAQIHVN